jgi:ATP-dependent DNA helicase DinG
MTPKTFAEAEAVLAEALPGYESRPQQQALAAAVENVLASGGQGLFEAGCGTGKSLGAMIPAILSGKRTVVATATIALMEQYANKDVPFLQENLGVDFNWALLKGRSNYFCVAKAMGIADRSKLPFDLDSMEAELAADPEHSGDREHFKTPVTKDQFSYVSSTSNDCPGKSECPFAAECYSERAKAIAADADVVITNTAMLMTDLKIRKATDGAASMLGDYDALILDEAHELEEIATSQLQEGIKPSGIERLVSEVRNFAATQQREFSDIGQNVLDATNAAWEILPNEQSLSLGWFVQNGEPFMVLVEALRDFAAQVSAIIVDGKKAEGRRAILTRRAYNLVTKISNAILADDDVLVRWVEEEETKGRNARTIKVLNTAPVHVGSFLQETIWENTPSALISATLSVSGKFDYLVNRLGLDNPQTLNVGTPFDYDNQAMLFVPSKDMPSPKDRGAWLTYSANTTLELVSKAGGGALLLFTSRSALNNAYDMLADRLRTMGYTPLRQYGTDGTNKEIAAKFQADENSVLFAVKSFFTGVDFAGDTCRLVVIDKLPFPVPTEPVFQARSNQIEKNGGNSFGSLTIPAMTLTLVQGFGRLIRTKNDKGVVAILDSRLSGTGYGKGIVRSLPDSPVTTSLDQVQSFYEG